MLIGDLINVNIPPPGTPDTPPDIPGTPDTPPDTPPDDPGTPDDLSNLGIELERLYTRGDNFVTLKWELKNINS